MRIDGTVRSGSVQALARPVVALDPRAGLPGPLAADVEGLEEILGELGRPAGGEDRSPPIVHLDGWGIAEHQGVVDRVQEEAIGGELQVVPLVDDLLGLEVGVAC